jgi:hypothetical protein
MKLRGAKYAIRPIFDEETNVSAGWQVIEMVAEHSDSVYGTKIGELEGDPLNVRALAFVQFVIASLEEQEKARAGMAQQGSRHGDAGEPAIEGDILRSPDAQGAEGS